MKDSLSEVKRILRLYRIHPRKRMGQNFVVDEEVFSKMIDYVDLGGDETVLEIGSGLGFLTERLAKTCGKVIAVEADRKLIRILKNRLGRYRNVELIHGDIFRVHLPEFDKIVSTPPYSISSKLILWLLERKNLELAVLTLQDEFAKRLAAPIGSRDYGRLTVTAYYHAEIEALDKIPRDSFYPPPKVDSRIVLIKPREPPFKVRNITLYRELVKSLFTQRRRKVRKGILPFLKGLGLEEEKAKPFIMGLPFLDVRVKDLAPEDFGLLSDEISKKLEDSFL